VSEELEAQETLAESLRAARKADVREVLESPAGRRVLERVLFEFGGLQAQSYASTELQLARDTGQRDVGCALDRELEQLAPEGWALMHAERIERRRAAPRDPKPNKTDQ